MGCFCICDFRGWTCVLSLKGWAMGTGMDSHLSISFSWEEKLGAKSCSFLVNALTPAQSLSDQAPEAGCSGKTEKLLCKIACSLHRSAYNSTPPPNPSLMQQRVLWVLPAPLQDQCQTSAIFHWDLWYPKGYQEEAIRRESRTGRVFLDWAPADREARVTVESRWTRNETYMSMKSSFSA